MTRRAVPPKPSAEASSLIYSVLTDRVVGGTGLAVEVREGSEAEAWAYPGLYLISQNARSLAVCGG